MDTLVVCVDRTGDLARKAGVGMPVAGWEAVRSLVVDIGLSDPEDSGVNCLLEALRVCRDLRDGADDADVAVVSGAGESVVGPDRALAEQLDSLLASHDPESVVVVVDSPDDEQVVPMIESRIRVDAVDRVVVRQARDIESTYYLLKQFLGDEELRQSVLVPLGIVLLVFPALLMFVGPAAAVAAITAVVGLSVLYKGLGVGERLTALSGELRDAIYSGRVSIVTYVVAAGLATIGVFAGALGTSEIGNGVSLLLSVASFAYASVPWLALAALAASAGRLLDEAIRNERVGTPYLNLPFGIVAIALVVRGFSAYFLERAEHVAAISLPRVDVGVITVEEIALQPGERLALFVAAGVLVSLVGIRVAQRLSDTDFEEELVR
jgi:putative membrane protein